MQTDILVFAGSAFLIGIVGGVLIGRRTGSAARRLRDLESQLDAARAELEIYRERVVEHFSRTSDLVRDLTLQYRTVYDHLADGARSLCPDATPALGRGIEAALLTEPEASPQGASPPPETASEIPAPTTVP